MDCFCALHGQIIYFVTWSNNGRLPLKMKRKVCVGSFAARKPDEAFVEKDYSYGWRGESSIQNIPQHVEILYMCVYVYMDKHHGRLKQTKKLTYCRECERSIPS